MGVTSALFIQEIDGPFLEHYLRQSDVRESKSITRCPQLPKVAR